MAEGVEDTAALERVRAVGVHVIQGYHTGRPMSEEVCSAWLERSATGRLTA